MKKIGLLSDTHGYLDDVVFKHFEQCDEVWHAGGDRSRWMRHDASEKRLSAKIYTFTHTYIVCV